MSAQLQVTGEAKIRDIQGPVVANSGVVTALDGAASQYVRGDGTLADFPTSTGGGSSVSYYLNSSVSQGTIGGVAYRELSKEPIIGAGTDIAISANGYVANYLTDANDPDVLSIPGGNFNCEFYFSVNNNTGNPTFYAELYKYDGTTFTLLGTSAGVPESINQGTTIAPYYFAIPVATAALSVTDRLAIRIYVNVSSRTITLHTENGHLCQVVTTLSKGMVSLNNLTDQSQYLATGTSGTNFAIVSSGDTHTFNLPVASATNTGKLSSTDWSTFNGKVPYTGATSNVDLGTYSLTAGGVYSHNIVATKDGIASGGLAIEQGTSSGVPATGISLISSSGNFFELKTTTGIANTKLANIDLGSLTNNSTRTFTLPDLSGTLALLEADNMFTQVNMFDQSVNFKANGSLVGTSGYISQAYAKTGSGAGSTLSLKIQDGNSLKAINLDFVGSPATYTYTYPALSGTMALLEGTQTFSGAKTFSGLASFTNTSGINLQYGAYINKGNTPLAFSSGTTNIYSDATTNNIVIRDNSSIAKLEFNNSTQTYTFPAASGTLALTSNLSAYLPLTGGTLTGALSGTSATFSSSVNVVGTLIAGNASNVGKVEIGSVGSSSTAQASAYLRIGDEGAARFWLQQLNSSYDFTIRHFNSGWSSPLLTIASTGAATFSNSVTFATGYNFIGTNRFFQGSNGTYNYIHTGATALQILNQADTSALVTILNGGNVGIGISNPSPLTAGALITQINSSNANVELKLTNSSASNGFLIAQYGVNNYISNRENGFMAFDTNATERMRITSGGAVLMGIGTNSASARLALDAIGMAVYDGGFYRQCYMDSNIMYWYNGSNQASLTSAGVWTDASDISIKKDIVDIKYGLDAVLELKPRSYKMKNDDLEQVGFIAQEVEQVIAELVSTDNKGMKGLSYGQLTAVLVKAVQELEARIKQLENK